jgi:hypothetical protein
VLRLDGERLWLTGKRDRAWKRLAESLESAERLSMGPECARGHATSWRLLQQTDAPPRVAGLTADEHRAKYLQLRATLEVFGWAEAGAMEHDPLEGIQLPVEA